MGKNIYDKKKKKPNYIRIIDAILDTIYISYKCNRNIAW